MAKRKPEEESKAETGMEIKEQIEKIQEAYFSLLPEGAKTFLEMMGMPLQKPQKEKKQEKTMVSRQALSEKVSSPENDSIIEMMLKQVEINEKMTKAYLLYLDAAKNTLQLMAHMEKFALFPYNRK